ncbi:hypothetical protein V8C86DRAFT_2878149 [Haematococcus lacustris]
MLQPGGQRRQQGQQGQQGQGLQQPHDVGAAAAGFPPSTIMTAGALIREGGQPPNRTAFGWGAAAVRGEGGEGRLGHGGSRQGLSARQEFRAQQASLALPTEGLLRMTQALQSGLANVQSRSSMLDIDMDLMASANLTPLGSFGDLGSLFGPNPFGSSDSYLQSMVTSPLRHVDLAWPPGSSSAGLGLGSFGSRAAAALH